MKTTHDPIKQLKIVHIALCIGASLVIILNHFVVKRISLDGIMGSMNVISITGLVIGGLFLLSAHYMFNKKTIELGTDINSQNLNEYRAAYVLKWALIEGAIFINVFFYFFMDSDPINMLVSMLLLLVLYYSKPLIA